MRTQTHNTCTFHHSHKGMSPQRSSTCIARHTLLLLHCQASHFHELTNAKHDRECPNLWWNLQENPTRHRRNLTQLWDNTTLFGEPHPHPHPPTLCMPLKNPCQAVPLLLLFALVSLLFRQP